MSDPALWDEEYRAGRWDYLLEPREQGRLAVTACYVHLYGPGAVLDVGSGACGLYAHLDPRRVRSYTAVDFAAAALEEARGRIGAGDPIPAEFVCASAEGYRPPAGRRFNSIVLAEVLYFIADPLAEMARYARCLAPGGVLIVSLAHIRAKRSGPDRKTEALLEAIMRGPYAMLDEVVLHHPPSGNAWRVRALRPKG